MYGGPGFAVSVCDGSVCAVFSAERRVSYGALLLADTPAGELSFSRDKAVVTDGGYTVCELSCEYIDDYSAFVLSASAVSPAEYVIAPAPGAYLSAPVGERTRGTDFTVKWLASGKRSLCIAVCGAAEPDGNRIIFTGGNGYVVLCEGDDLNEITSRVSQVVSLYEQGYFGRRSFPARQDKGDGSAAARILSVFRGSDGLILRDAFDMRADAFTQYLCVRAYCAQESCDRAADLLTACVSRFETGSPVWISTGKVRVL